MITFRSVLRKYTSDSKKCFVCNRPIEVWGIQSRPMELIDIQYCTTCAYNYEYVKNPTIEKLILRKLSIAQLGVLLFYKSDETPYSYDRTPYSYDRISILRLQKQIKNELAKR